jgi:hypothetical protein
VCELGRIQERLKEKRAAQAEEEKKATVQNELIRRKGGQVVEIDLFCFSSQVHRFCGLLGDQQELTEVKKQREMEELKQLADQKRREKIADAAAKERVRQQIAADKAARVAAAAKGTPPNTSAPVPALGNSVAVSAVQPSVAGAPTKVYTEVRLQVRQLAGTPLTAKFAPTDTLQAVVGTCDCVWVLCMG